MRVETRRNITFVFLGIALLHAIPTFLVQAGALLDGLEVLRIAWAAGDHGEAAALLVELDGVELGHDIGWRVVGLFF